MKALASVAVPVPLRRVFHYTVPDHLEARAVPGARIQVPFGRQRMVAYIVARGGVPEPGIKLRAIDDVLDDEPVFDPPLLALLQWMAGYYKAPLGEVLRAAHPSGINAKGAPALRLTAAGAQAPRTGAVAAVLAQLDGQSEPVPIKSLDPAPSDAQLRRMRKAGWVERIQILERPRVEARRKAAYQAVAPARMTPRGPGGRTLKRDAIHTAMVGRGKILLSTLKAEHGASAGAELRKLVDEGTVARTEVEVLRDPFLGEPVARDQAPTLTAAQSRAVAAIGGGDGFAGYLLHGVTGSGKTEVYLHAIEALLEADGGALVLVPEIALTPQLVRRFRARLGDAIAVLHSGLSPGARFDQWRRLRAGDLRVAIGARSAVFAPVKNLRLIVVDEEHDPSYKQHDGVRYQARDMALARGARLGAAVVLGTATPSLESTRNAEVGKLTRLVLAERPTGGTLPAVRLIDMNEEKAEDAHGAISPSLRVAIAGALQEQGQTILFLNRRGYSNYVRCDDCRAVIECDRCAIALTWHQRLHRLRCHYCDANRPLPPCCDTCKKDALVLPGRGTERIEESLHALFPDATVARMDRDTTTGRKLETLLRQMRDGQIDILIGTQMVTKGHDFPNVTLVGVLEADAALNFPDFRADERAFQLLTQVAGRAGRGRKAGHVLIQTWDPTQSTLVASSRHDHAQFCTDALPIRALQGYPPFAHAVTLRLDGRPAEAVQTATEALARRVRAAGSDAAGVIIRGPAPAPIERIRDRTRWALMLTAPNRAALHQILDRVLDGLEPPPGDLRLVVDVDPYDFL